MVPKFLVYFLPLLLLIAGLVGVWNGVGDLVDGFRSSGWPQTSGLVTRSELGSESRFEDGADPSPHYWPEVEYEYEAEGKSYTGDNVNLDGLRSGPHIGTGKKEAEAVLRKYPKGSSVVVYYDSSSPERATLQAGFSPASLLTPAFCLVLIIACGGWLWFASFSSAAAVGDDAHWAGRERRCPRCEAMFTSVQDKGTCPECKHVFYASDTVGPA